MVFSQTRPLVQVSWRNLQSGGIPKEEHGSFSSVFFFSLAIGLRDSTSSSSLTRNFLRVFFDSDLLVFSLEIGSNSYSSGARNTQEFTEEALKETNNWSSLSVLQKQGSS